MSDAQNQGEPTMEEILASIRKIINEDGTPAEAAEGEPAEAEEAPPVEEQAVEEPPAAEEAPPVEEPAAEQEPEDSDDDDEDVLDLTKMVGEDGEVVDLKPDSSEPEELVAEELVADEPEEPPVEEADDDEEIPDLIAIDQEIDQAPEETPAEDDRSLVSDETRVAATASLAGLATAASPRDGGLLTDSKTLEDLVRESLEPYLKAWLDQNLPGLVERIVREEIQKMVRRAEYR